MRKATWTIAVLLVVYIGAYLVLLNPDRVVIHDSGSYYSSPVYRVGGEVTDTVLLPIHLADRLLRPKRWQVPNEELPNVVPFKEQAVSP